MTIALVLNIAGLLIGLVAAVLMFYFPPRITLYTEKGEPHVNWIGNETEEGNRRGRYQIWLSKAAPWLLATAFLLQLISALLPSSTTKTANASIVRDGLQKSTQRHEYPSPDGSIALS